LFASSADTVKVTLQIGLLFKNCFLIAIIFFRFLSKNIEVYMF
jgi:hypothetical protein